MPAWWLQAACAALSSTLHAAAPPAAAAALRAPSQLAPGAAGASVRGWKVPGLPAQQAWGCCWPRGGWRPLLLSAAASCAPAGPPGLPAPCSRLLSVLTRQRGGWERSGAPAVARKRRAGHAALAGTAAPAAPAAPLPCRHAPPACCCAGAMAGWLKAAPAWPAALAAALAGARAGPAAGCAASGAAVPGAAAPSATLRAVAGGALRLDGGNGG